VQCVGNTSAFSKRAGDLIQKIMSKSLANKHEEIVSRIYFIRGQKVMLDFDLAEMYEVETKRLKEAVRRNLRRFPEDFMFELTQNEYTSLRTQIATLKRGKHAKYPPFAFTEQGVAMLSGILKSDMAIDVNIAIMRAFVQLRKLIDTNKELAHKIEALEKKYDQQFCVVFDAIKELIHQKNEPLPKVGYKK